MERFGDERVIETVRAHVADAWRGAGARLAASGRPHRAVVGLGPGQGRAGIPLAHGELAVVRRNGFEKIYDLAERVIPKPLLEAKPSRAQVTRLGLRSGTRAPWRGDAEDAGGFLGSCVHRGSEALDRGREEARPADRCRAQGGSGPAGFRGRGAAGYRGAASGLARADLAPAGALALRSGAARPRPRGPHFQLRLPHRSLRAAAQAQARLLRVPAAGRRAASSAAST